MQQWRVSDVMTTDVITASGNTPVAELVDIMSTHRVSAVPIVGDDRNVLGVVSQADLLAKVAATGPSGARPPRRRRGTKTAATSARELMSAPALSIAPDTPLSAAAWKMQAKNVKWLLVTGDTQVAVRLRLGADVLHIASAAGAVVAVHRLAPAGAGRVVRDDGHVLALEKAVLSAFTNTGPCRHKTRRPPSSAARAEAARLRGLPADNPAARVVIDMSSYATAAARLGRSSPSAMDGVDSTISEENTL
jgi:CBS domain-containing protein